MHFLIENKERIPGKLCSLSLKITNEVLNQKRWNSITSISIESNQIGQREKKINKSRVLNLEINNYTKKIRTF